MICENCIEPVSYGDLSEIMRRDDAEHFANFEDGMEDYMPDSMSLCHECAGLVFEKDWFGLIRRQPSPRPPATSSGKPLASLPAPEPLVSAVFGDDWPTPRIIPSRRP